MAYSEALAERVREALSSIRKVEEKKMFRGITFMVNGKMCVSVGNDELMCRIDPENFESVLERNGVRPMVHGSRTMRGFVFVNEAGFKSKRDFDYWLNLALDFNKKAKATKKKK